MEKIIEDIADIVSRLKYYEWRKIVTAIEKKYSSKQAKVQLTNSEELKKAIQIEM